MAKSMNVAPRTIRTSSATNTSTSRQAHVSSWRDYYQLTKPKVIYLLMLTALVGMCLAVETWVPPLTASLSLLGIGLVCASAAAINQILDRNIDDKMARTQGRPLPKGRVDVLHASVFAAILALLGFSLLFIAANALTAWLTLASMLGYAVVYTLFLKRATPQNIVIGGLAGAMPPLLGWTAMTGQLDGNALLLVMIIFTWTPPHFWALAIHRRDDYAKANIPMLPVTHGIEFTKTCVLLYTLLLCAVALLPCLTGLSSWLYGGVVMALNLRFLQHAWRLKFKPQPNSAINTFKFSIIHLMILFLALLLDHWLL